MRRFFILNCEIYLNSGSFWGEILAGRTIMGIFAVENGRDEAIAGKWALHGCADVANEG